MSEKKNLDKIERESSSIIALDSNLATNMVEIATSTNIMATEDKKFFLENTDRWNQVQQNCHIWRTDVEKKSILSELPTTHLQFHQAILENKVFVDETVRLAKDGELMKLDAEELHADIEKLQEKISDLEEKLSETEDEKEQKSIKYEIHKRDIKLRKKTVELQEKAYQIKQSAIAMKYRVDELKDWKAFEDQMIEKMISEGYTEEQIWDKAFGQKEGYFFHFLTKYQGVFGSKDGGEIHNLTYLARFAVDSAIQDKVFKQYLRRCNQIQLHSLSHLGYIRVKTDKDEKTGVENIVGVEILVPTDPEDK